MKLATIVIVVLAWLLCCLGAFRKYSAFYTRKGWPPFSSRPLFVRFGMCWAGPISLFMSVSEIMDHHADVQKVKEPDHARS